MIALFSNQHKMKQLNSQALIDQLSATLRDQILQVHYLQQKDPEILLTQPGDGKWSIAQVLEHLNSYGRYYLPWMEKVLSTSRYPARDSYKPGWLGNYFTKSMLPNDKGVVSNKMSSPKNHRPDASLDSHSVMLEFLQQGKTLLLLLEKARQHDLGRLKVPISIAKFVKIKLGDTFRFYLAHQQRHFVQIANILKAGA